MLLTCSTSQSGWIVGNLKEFSEKSLFSFIQNISPQVRDLVVMFYIERRLTALVFIFLVTIHIGWGEWEIILRKIVSTKLFYANAHPESLERGVEGDRRIIHLKKSVITWDLRSAHLKHSKNIVFIINWLDPNICMIRPALVKSSIADSPLGNLPETWDNAIL